jgi:hypothetical protein
MLVGGVTINAGGDCSARLSAARIGATTRFLACGIT